MSKLSKHDERFGQMAEIRPFEGLSRISPHAAGADIGAHEIVVCVPGSEGTQVVRTFGNYTVDLQAMGQWLMEQGIESIAMESTGIYWIPLFETLETYSLKCCLISAASIKRFPGRKSDVLDCQWIQTLHSYGLLADSFRPEADLIALRTLLRHRAELIQHRSPHILHMQKALLHMNLQLSAVLSDVTGKTGMAILQAIIHGERDPHKLAAFRDQRCRKKEDEIAKALTGTWREEHLFVLKQALELYEFYTQQIAACDGEIERTYALIRPQWKNPEDDSRPQPKKLNVHNKNSPHDRQLHQHLRRIAGVDLVAVDGISLSLAQTILAEIGTDMRKFPAEQNFCSWLGLAPHNDISGGKVLRSYTLKTHNRAGQAFRQAAATLTRADCAFGAFYRRLKSRLGPAQALVATAHKMARVVYHMLKFQIEYQTLTAGEYEQRFRQREIQYLQRKASRLGFAITPLTPAPMTTVS